jgi:subtilisin family serine protease
MNVAAKSAAVALAALSVALLGAMVSQASATPEAVPARRGAAFATVDDIVAEIEQHGEAHVLVSLALDSSPSAANAGQLDRLRRSVAVSQGRVLGALANAGDFARSREQAAVMIRRQFEHVPAFALTVRTRGALRRIVAHPAVVGVQLDTGGTGTLGGSVPFIEADLRHALGNDGDGVTVAVLDTGADLDHPDLVDDILANQACFGDNNSAIDGVGFCPNGSDRQTGAGSAEDDAGHGTHVTGIVTSAGTVSSPGAAPGAEIVSIKVTDNCNFSGCFYAFSEIVAAWDWIIANNATLGIQVMNMSFGTGTQYAGDCDTTFPAAATAIATLQTMGVIAFASAGNNGGTMMGAPACLSDVVSVGATDNADNVTNFSDSNATTDIFAPGLNVTSLAIGGGTTQASGTSMASPHAAACAALLIDAGDATTPAAIETRLETSPFQVTDAAGLTFPRIDCSPEGDPPVADIGGPYTTDEGTNVTLDASGSSDPEGGVLTYAWDLDDDGDFDDATGVTAVFDDVGQDGVFTVGVRVTDPLGESDEAETTVTVDNVAPSVNLGSDGPVPENTTVTVSGTISDPGWEESLTATIDWDDGAGPSALAGTLENVRPHATLTFSASHVYGDNGTFDVEVCGADDDTSTCATVAVTVTNVAPTATIDTSGAVAFPGGPALVATIGEPLDVSGRSTDPGSDDLALSWDWDDGPPAPDVTTAYLNAPPSPDPFPSPEINPRDVTDSQSHTFTGACFYEVGFAALDDDAGSASDSVDVVILGDADLTRSAGYWYQQYRGGPAQQFDDATLGCYLEIVGLVSSVFHELTDASTPARARDVLRNPSGSSSVEVQLDRQLLAAWLNFANGAVAWDELVDTDGDGVADTEFGVVVSAAEADRLNPASTDAVLEAHKDVLELINVSG